MMLTRSFLTSYLILPDTAKNINLLEEGIGFVNLKQQQDYHSDIN